MFDEASKLENEAMSDEDFLILVNSLRKENENLKSDIKKLKACINAIAEKLDKHLYNHYF